MTGRRSCSVWTLASAVFLVALATPNAQTSRAPGTSSSPGATLPPEEHPRVLQAEVPIERALTPADTHAYLLSLDAGQSAHVLIEQRGIDVLASLAGASAQATSEFESENEVLSFWIVAEEPGGFRLTVRALNTWAAPGRYEIRVQEVRPADLRDRRRGSAQRARAAAE